MCVSQHVLASGSHTRIKVLTAEREESERERHVSGVGRNENEAGIRNSTMTGDDESGGNSDRSPACRDGETGKYLVVTLGTYFSPPAAIQMP